MTEPLWSRVLTPERRRFVKFGLVGTSGMGVNEAFVWVGHQLFAGLAPPMTKALASALGIVVSVFTNFLINDSWTWGDRKKGKRKRDFFGRMARYYLAGSVAIAIQFATANSLSIGLGMNPYLTQAIGILLGMMVNFFVNNFWTFREREPTHPHPEAEALGKLPPDNP